MTVWGVVPTDGRGSLPFALVHGESLVAAATWALEAAEVELLDFDVRWERLADDDVLVVHDPLCPLTPVAFIAESVRRCEESGRPVVGVLPVTDTIKHLEGDLLGETLDRDELRVVASPLVLPARSLPLVPAGGLSDLVTLVDRLCARTFVELLTAPAGAARVRSKEDLQVLEASAPPAQQ